MFTEFQILMLVLTATGLTVGVTVNERQQADRAVREVEALLRSKEAEAEQAARFNLVSSMASALAHEINQPITAARALGRAAQHLLHTDSGSHARVDDNLTTMIAQIDHAAGVVKRMREFLRRGEPHISTINVRALIDDALILVGTEASGAAIRIEVDASPDLPSMHADRVQLQQVILNLVQNSIDAIAAAGRSDGRIRVAAALARQSPARRNRGLRQRRRHRAGAGGAAVRAAHDLQARRAWALASRSARQSCSRITAGSGYNRAHPVQPNSASGSRSNRQSLS